MKFLLLATAALAGLVCALPTADKVVARQLEKREPPCCDSDKNGNPIYVGGCEWCGFGPPPKS
ncbi:unnamed protein product [Cercospora beticola]|nr:unnamed protein product [Cercospora beticola]